MVDRTASCAGIALGAVLAPAACGGSSSGTGQPPTESSSTTEPHGDGTGTTEPDGGDSGTSEPHGDGAGTTDPDGDSSGPDTPEPPTDTTYPVEPDGGTGTGGGSVAWGPLIDGSGLSPVFGAQDEFSPEVAAALMRAARAAPNGASQSSSVEADGRTAGQVTVHVEYDDLVGHLVHVITDNARMVANAPSAFPRQGLGLAHFTDLIPGIEPDLSSCPHEVLGVWAWGGQAGAFWSASQPVPPVAFGARTPDGVATYEGDAAALLTAFGTAMGFTADVELVADFDSRTVGGTVDAFRPLVGELLPAPPLTLGTTAFSPQGAPFSGATSGAIPGGSEWGALDGRSRRVHGRDVRLRRPCGSGG